VTLSSGAPSKIPQLLPKLTPFVQSLPSTETNRAPSIQVDQLGHPQTSSGLSPPNFLHQVRQSGHPQGCGLFLPHILDFGQVSQSGHPQFERPFPIQDPQPLLTTSSSSAQAEVLIERVHFSFNKVVLTNSHHFPTPLLDASCKFFSPKQNQLARVIQ
jgi:hypothetical protein